MTDTPTHGPADVRDDVAALLSDQPSAIAALAAGTGTHAWLVVGASPAVRDTFIAQLAARQFGPLDGNAARQVTDHTHPDLRHIQPDGANYSVAQLRQLAGQAVRQPLAAPRQLLVIDDAERLGEAAQNTLLKTLEEPGRSTTVVLSAATDGAMLDTILSRVRHVTLTPTSDEVLTDRARQRGAGDQAELLAGACHGDLTRLDQLTDPSSDEAERRHTSLHTLARLLTGDVDEALAAADDVLAAADQAADELAGHADERIAELDDMYDGNWPAGMRKDLTARRDRLRRRHVNQWLHTFLDDQQAMLADVLRVRAGQQPTNADHADDVNTVDAHAGDVSSLVRAVGQLVHLHDRVDVGQPKLQLQAGLGQLAATLRR